MKNYKRPLKDILAEVVSGIEKSISVLSVVSSGANSVVSCCDILYAQKGFNVSIGGYTYEIVAFSHADESLTLKPTFEGSHTIQPGTAFDLYPVKFYHGTPITTNVELGKVVKAKDKTPMIWLWENFKEKITEDEIVERSIPVELYALTQSPVKQAQMINDDLHTECVEPMRRLIELFKEQIVNRSDLFSTDEIEYEAEDFPKFGIVARNRGSEKALFMDNLSGEGFRTTLLLWFQDACNECNVPILNEGIGVMEIGETFIVS